MYHYGHPPTIYHQPGVTQHTDLGRYEKSPPPAQRSFSVNTRKGTNGAPFREDVTLILRQQPKEALVTTDGKEKDAAFFVFGDISVKVHGTFRLHFSLFDLRKETNDVAYLGAITSEPFRVLLPKDFKGMDESTYLSRAFSDQGVRLRLRKEPRAMMYGFLASNESPSSNAPIRPNMNEYASYGEDGSSPNKRYRPATEDRKDQFADNSNVSGVAFSSSYAASQYSDRMPSLGPSYSMPQYSAYEDITTGTTAPYQFRPPGTSSYFPDSIHQTSGTNTMSGTMPTQRYPDMQQQQQPYAHMFSYKQPRTTISSAPSFPGDTIGLNVYRMGPTAGLGDDTRPATSTGNPTAMAPQTPQLQNSARQTHNSIDPSRGVSYSHSPDLVRSAGFPSLGAQLPNPHRPERRYDDQSQMTSSLYPPQRNYIQAPPTESSLTSHTDSGAIPPSLHFLPDLIQSTEEHIADSG